MAKRPGLYANIHAKRKRIKAGSNEKMRKKVPRVRQQKMRLKRLQKSKGRNVARKAVEAPKGYHWMKSGKNFKLMKNPSTGYKPHKGASKKASFEVQKVHK